MLCDACCLAGTHITNVHSQDPDDVITDLQKEVFETQGIAGEWGIKCLGLVADTYEGDSEFMQLFVAMVERYAAALEALHIVAHLLNHRHNKKTLK